MAKRQKDTMSKHLLRRLLATALLTPTLWPGALTAQTPGAETPPTAEAAVPQPVQTRNEADPSPLTPVAPLTAVKPGAPGEETPAPLAAPASITDSVEPGAPTPSVVVTVSEDAPSRYALLPEAIRAGEEIARAHGLDPQWVQQQIASAQALPQVMRLVLPPRQASQKNWSAYRARFTDAARVAAGRRFWLAHREHLQRAEDTYGVPAHLIVGVLGVESIYGRQTGNFRVIDVLCTLAFDFPAEHPRAQARQAFFREELGQFLRLAQRDGMDPQSVRGSYAGALGWPQFMPGSWLRHAVDFDADGRVDLINSPVDAIGSVANYFRAYGWERDQPTHYPVRFEPQRLDLSALLAPDIVPSFTVEELAAKGALLEADTSSLTGKLALIELRNGDPMQGGAMPSYWIGTHNFYVLTRYNWSSYYAMAVIELGQQIRSTLNAR